MTLKNTISYLELKLSKVTGTRIDINIAEQEGKEYWAHQALYNQKKAIFRKAKSTPTKKGQFVTVWKRNTEGITAPYHDKDDIAYFIILSITENAQGVFIFPKEALLKNKIMASKLHDGKRGFRVYPPWEKDLSSKQAIKTQEWQVQYFSQFDELIK